MSERKLVNKYKTEIVGFYEKELKMDCPAIVDLSAFIAPYIKSCYNDSLFCDLIVVCAEDKCVSCHKIVLCSLSEKLLSLCKDEDQVGNLTYLHLQDFSHKDVKDTVDMIYASIGKKKVKIDKNEVINVLGIEDALRKPKFKQETHDLPGKDDFQAEGVDMGDFVKSELTCDITEEEELDGSDERKSFTQQLESLNIIRYHDYTSSRLEFWEEHYVKVILKVS